MVAIDDDDVAVLDAARRVLDPADDGNVESPRDDRHMRGRRTFFEHQADDPAMRVIEQLGRTHCAGDQDELGGSSAHAALGGRSDRCCCSRLARSSRSTSRSRR